MYKYRVMLCLICLYLFPQTNLEVRASTISTKNETSQESVRSERAPVNTNEHLMIIINAIKLALRM